jgi:hypothetical protein
MTLRNPPRKKEPGKEVNEGNEMRIAMTTNSAAEI